MPRPAAQLEPALWVAVVGNPNAGKSTIFNRLTGLRQKVGNYPGVTVEKKLGSCVIGDRRVELIDLPGACSLTAQSPDEQIARDVLFGWQPDTPSPDVVVIVVDASNLERNLFLACQVIELGYPTVLVLNMTDLVEATGAELDDKRLAARLGVPVVRTVASRGIGLDELRSAILAARVSQTRAPLPPAVEREVDELAERLVPARVAQPGQAVAVALRLLSSPDGPAEAAARGGDELAAAVLAARERLADHGIAWQGCEAATRYEWLRRVAAEAIRGLPSGEITTATDRVDAIVTHRFWGPVLFFLSMAVVFQTIYAGAVPFMDWIDRGFTALGSWLRPVLGDGLLAGLLVDGVVTGVGAVVVFLPQILLLFFFLCVLEDTGYMARAAFVMDRIMSKVGLHGRSFVPLLSSFACAIPGIMAARTIGSRRDRLATILVAPLITCSARLPVYSLLIAAFVPPRTMFHGLLSLQGLTLIALYLLGIAGALTMAAVLKRTILRGPTPALLLELPPYRWPDWRNIARELFNRAFLFVRFAGTVILSLSIVLWFLSSFPQVDPDTIPSTPAAAASSSDEPVTAAQWQLENSYLGRMGRAIEPAVRPLGFDWHIGVGLLAAFAAREVMVSTLGILYSVGEQESETDTTLIERLRQARRADGAPLFTIPVVCSLLVFFVFACQCISTIGVVVRETGGWKWAGFMVSYMTALAYVASFLTYRIALWWGGGGG